MSKTIADDYRKEYNELLVKEKNQEKFLDTDMFKQMSEASQANIIDQYKKTGERLNQLLMEIKFYKRDNILNGFDIKSSV